jgi:hypothetical protein
MNPNAPQNDDTDTPNNNPAPQTPISQPAPDVLFPGTPQVVPVSDQTPAQPVTPTDTTGAPAPQPNKKKALIIAGIIGGVILLAIIAVLAYLSLTTVSKADYKEAAMQFKVISKENSELISKIIGLSTGLSGDSEEEFSAAVKEVETSLNTIEAENEKLGDMKAVKVGEGKEVYEAFDTKLDAYVSYGNDLVTSVKKVRPALVTCEKISEAVDNPARVAALKECSGSLDPATDVPNKDFKKFITTLRDTYKTYAETYEGITALSSPFGAQSAEYTTLRSKMLETQKTLSDATKEFSQSVQKKDDEVRVKDVADSLSKYLTEQAS